MIRKSLSRLAGAWPEDTFRAYVSTLVEAMSWRVALALALMLAMSATQGAQLVMLIPLMQLVGLNVQQGSVGWISDALRSVFAFLGISLTPPAVLAVFVVFTTLLALITRWQTNFNFKLQQDFVALLRQRLYRAIVNSDWLTFSRTRSSDFTHALTTELDRVGGATAMLLRFTTSSIMVLIYLVLALQLSAAMTGTVFVSGAGLLLLLRTKSRTAKWTGEEISLATNGMYSAAIEHLGGMKTVKSYGAEERNVAIFSDLTGKVTGMYLKAARNYAETAFWFNVGSVSILSVILLVSLEVLGLSAAELLLLLFLFNRMIPLFNGIQQSYQQYLNALPAFAGVMELRDRCEAAAEMRIDCPRKPTTLHEGIEFEGVRFSYGGEKAAIRDLDLYIPAGKTTAIVGPSGAGKSTVADLLMGLISPERGRLSVDGATLDAGRIRSWREKIGYVSQDTFVFNDTVRANLLWACPEASEAEISRALEMAAARDFVHALPEKMETALGDRGVRLSGGERQRLALARALLRNPELLILDEAASALDSENERRIQSAIDELHGRTTILVITHRLSAIREADAIHVLEDGGLVESGSWDDLLSRAGGRFGELAGAQGIYTVNASSDVT